MLFCEPLAHEGLLRKYFFYWKLWLELRHAVKHECAYTWINLILERSSTPNPNAAAVEIYLGSRFACFKVGSLISLRLSSIILWHIRSRATGSLPTIIPL